MAVAFVGAAVLTGWLLHIEPLKDLHSNLATMKPNTAVAFLLAGAALAIADFPHLQAGRRRSPPACAA